MATPRKRWFRVGCSILREPWTRDEKMTLVLLTAWLSDRWARDGIDDPDEACRAVLSPGAMAEITGRTQLAHARRALRALGERVSCAIQVQNEFTVIYWPKFADFQELPSGGRAKRGRDHAPSAPAPSSAPSKEKSMRARTRSRAPSEPPEPLDPEKLVNILGAANRSAALPWLRDQLPHIEAAARRALALEGIEEPTPKQLRVLVIERIHAFWRQQRKSATAAGTGRQPAAPGSLADLRERAQRLYSVESLLPEPTVEALAAWEQQGSPREPGWWLDPDDKPLARTF